MTFRTRLLVFFGLAIAATSIIVSYAISLTVTRAFERLDAQRTQTLTAQFQREFQWRSQEVVRRVESIASSDSVLRMTSDLSRPSSDPAPYHDLAAAIAREQDLDFLEFLDPSGAIISSAHYPARFGYKKDWITQPMDWRGLGAFVEIEELPEESAIALLAVRTLAIAGSTYYILGGQRIDKGFLDTFATPQGVRAVLYRDVSAVLGASRYNPPEIEDLVVRIRNLGREASTTVAPWFEAPRNLHGIPLSGRGKDLLAVLLLTSTRDELYQLTWFIRWVALLGSLAGIALGIGLAWWATSRVTRPVHELAAGAREVATGNWSAQVPVTSQDEIGDLAEAFNQMTRQLVEQRDRVLQVERVAAWRELARRLAHELKNPLFPLQITVENLQRARSQHPEQFDEVFRESTATLLAELSQLRAIIGRFSDFARMPAPRFEPLHLGEFLPPIVKLFEPQWQSPEHPPVRAEVRILDSPLTLEADPDQLTRALRNLIFNAMDAMPNGGLISVRAARDNGHVVVEVADTGAGLTPEECERLFTPYYTTKHHGTGLGLAIVQSVISDHGGRISVSSQPGRGTTFRLELPEKHSPNGPPPHH